MEGEAVQYITVAITLAALLTPLVVAAGVRDRALHNRIIATEAEMSRKLAESVKDGRKIVDALAEGIREEYVRDKDFTAAIGRLESAQREFRNETRTVIDVIHADIRNILTALARIEAKKIT